MPLTSFTTKIVRIDDSTMIYFCLENQNSIKRKNYLHKFLTSLFLNISSQQHPTSNITIYAGYNVLSGYQKIWCVITDVSGKSLHQVGFIQDQTSKRVTCESTQYPKYDTPGVDCIIFLQLFFRNAYCSLIHLRTIDSAAVSFSHDEIYPLEN